MLDYLYFCAIQKHYIMKQISFFALILLFTVKLQAQITEFPFVEGFDGTTFPPADWIGYAVVAGDREFERVTEGEWPDCLPHDGSVAMAQYNSFSAQAGDAAVLITPALSLTDQNTLRFWFFRSEDPSNNRHDKIEIYYNTTPDLVGATLLDSVSRAINFYPVVPFEDWYQYSYEFSSPQDTYIIFKAISAYGWKMYLDDIEVEPYSPDIDPPEVISLEGTQVYAQQEMNLKLRVRDNSAMPSTLDGEAIINGTTTDILMTKTSGSQGDFIYEGVISGQPDHTAGEIKFWLTDILGNATWSNTYSLHWDWVQPILEEGFEGEIFPPENWTITGKPLTWLTWDDYGLVYYTDSDDVNYEVTPPEGERQAAVEWDFQGNAQDEWMISPMVAITEDAVLTFKTFARLNSYDYDEYLVKVTTDGFNWNTIWSAADYPAGVTDYNEDISISLDSYIGSDIRVAWQAYNLMGTNLWYSWFVDDVKIRVTDTLVGTAQIEEPIISQAFPNPFTQSTQISFLLKNDGNASIILYSADGKAVFQKNLMNLRAGYQYIRIDGRDIPTGFYYYRLTTGEGITTGKLIRK